MNKIKFIIVTNFFLAELLNGVTWTDKIVDLSALPSKNQSITCVNSLTLTDIKGLEDAWVTANTSPTGTLSPSMTLLKQIKGYTKDGKSNFTLTTKCLIADLPSVLGALNSNITTWNIMYGGIQSRREGKNGQTATSLPSSIKTINIKKGGFLTATVDNPLILKEDQLLTVDQDAGGLCVQPNAFCSMLNSQIWSKLLGKVYIAGILEVGDTNYTQLKSSWFLPGSKLLTKNIFDDTDTGIGAIPIYINWLAGGGNSNSPQYVTKSKTSNFGVFGYVVSNGDKKFNNSIANITVGDGGTLQIFDNSLTAASLTVKYNGTLILSTSGNNKNFSPSYPITIESGGIFKFDKDMALSPELDPGKVMVQSGVIFDIPGNWTDINPGNMTLLTDFKNYPITLKTSNSFDLTKARNRSMLSYNTWNIGSSNQVFKLTNLIDFLFGVSNLTINLLPGASIVNDITLYPYQTLNRDVNASLLGRVLVCKAALLNIGSSNLQNVTASNITIREGGRLVIPETYLDNKLSTVDRTVLLNWSGIQDIGFDPESYFVTYTFIKDDDSNVGKIKSKWEIGAPGQIVQGELAQDNLILHRLTQTLTSNNKEITSIKLLPFGSISSPNLSQYDQYYTLKPSDNSSKEVLLKTYSFVLYSTQSLVLSKYASFFMDPGSVTQIQSGSIITGIDPKATDINVFVLTGATLETDGQHFANNFIRSTWFQPGSIFNTKNVFKDDGQIPYNVIWNIFSNATAEDSVDFQQANNASLVVQQITIKSGAYVGVAKDTTFSLRNNLIIESTGIFEVLAGGELAFDGGVLTLNDSRYKIPVYYGAMCTLAAENYSLSEVLNFLNLQYGAILAFGDAYEPATDTKPIYQGKSYTLSDDKLGLGMIPEGISFEFNNGIQTLMNVSPKAEKITFLNQGILEVSGDYPLSLYSGQVLDLNESDFDSTWTKSDVKLYPYRFFIRSGSTLFLQAGAKIVDYSTPYTILGTKAPIVIKTDAEIMPDIPGFNRWVKAIKSTYSDTGIKDIKDYTLNLFNGSNSDMNEFGKTNLGNGYRYNFGADLQLTTTNVVTDNQYGVAMMPFVTWNIASSVADYNQGQTLSRYPLTGGYLQAINILPGAFVFSIPNHELNLGECNVVRRAETLSTIMYYTTLNVLKDGTLWIVEDSLKASVKKLYLYAGSNLIVDGLLTVEDIRVENGANISGLGKIKVGEKKAVLATSIVATITPQGPSVPGIIISDKKIVLTKSNFKYNGGQSISSGLSNVSPSLTNPNFSNADFQTISVNNNGFLIFDANTFIVNNEDSIININEGGILEIDKTATVKNLGDITAKKGGTIRTNAPYFKDGNLLQSWLGEGSILITNATFADGMGGIKSIPSYVTWNINADESTNMPSFIANTVNVLANKLLTINSDFTIKKGQILSVQGELDITSNATCMVASGGILDLTSGSFKGEIEVLLGGLIINPINTKSIMCDGIIQNTIPWNTFPDFEEALRNAQWNIATPSSNSQIVSSIPQGVSTIRVLNGKNASFTLTNIGLNQKIVLEKGSTSSFVTSKDIPLTVSGVLEIMTGADFGTNPYITIASGGTLIVDGDVGNLINLTINRGGNLLGTNVIPDTNTSFLVDVKDGDVFEIGTALDQ